MYMRDRWNIVHVVTPFAEGDHSLCGEYFELDQLCQGPSTCADCKETAQQLRSVLRSAKFNKTAKLKTLKHKAD